MIKMDVSIIIVCYKAHERVLRCLEALASFSETNFSMEVIVVNNNPQDERFKAIEKRFTQFSYIHNSINGGYSNGSNLGASKAQGDYLLILNPDTTANEEAVHHLLSIAKSDPLYSIVSCRQVRENGKESKAWGHFPWKGSLYASKNRLSEIDNAGITFPDWVSGSVMMIRKDIYLDMKGFDEDFWMYYEDMDLCRRAQKNGGRIVFSNNITIEHTHGGSTREDMKITSIAKCEVQISRHLYIHKHESGIRRILLHIITIVDNLITGILTGLAGLILFLIPELFVRFLVFLRVASYYAGTLFRRSWISPRSVNFGK